MELNEAYVALIAQLQRVARSLTSEEARSVATGDVKLAVVRPGDRVLAKSKALDGALKVLSRLTAEELDMVERGTASLKLVRPGERVLAKSKALDAALKILGGLTAEDLGMIENRVASLKLVRRGGRIVYPVDHADVAEEVSRLESEAAIIKFLDSDDRLKPADLRKVATELGIVVPGSAKSKGDIETYIARHLMAYGMSAS
jgi:hypothetical protein